MSSIVPYDNYGNRSSLAVGNSFAPNFFSLQSQFSYVPQTMAFLDLASITGASLDLNNALLLEAAPWESSLNFDNLEFELNAGLEFDDLDFSFDF